MNKKTIIIIAILTLFSKVGLAWGKEGHQIVAQIAQQYIGGPGRDTINYYLNGLSFEEAATWMDEIKSDHQYDYMKSWHYINIERDATYVVNKSNIKERKKMLTPTSPPINCLSPSCLILSKLKP